MSFKLIICTSVNVSHGHCAVCEFLSNVRTVSVNMEVNAFHCG